MGDTQLPSRFSIAYRGAAKGSSYEEWREGICRGFCRLDAGPAAEDDYVDCRNKFAVLHSIALATPSGSSARFARTRDLQSDGCDDFVLISAWRGSVPRCSGRQDHRFIRGAGLPDGNECCRRRRSHSGGRFHDNAHPTTIAFAGCSVRGGAPGAAAGAQSWAQDNDRPVFFALQRYRRRSGRAGPKGCGATYGGSCRAFSWNRHRAKSRHQAPRIFRRAS
jgi:hypothetical protein